MNRLPIVFLAASVAWGQAAEPAQTDIRPADDAGRLPLLRDFARDQARLWTSPFKRDSYGSHTVQKYIIPFALISGALIASDNKSANLLPNTVDQTRWRGRVSQLGASYSLAGMSAATLLLGKATRNRHAQETGWLALNAIAHTQIVVFAVKQITNRERPLIYGGQAKGFWGGGDSFPSGHAATSFAVATVFAYEYRDHIAVPIAAYTLVTAIAASRTCAQRHWVSDIAVGGAAGFLIGRFVYKRHHDPDLPGSLVKRNGGALPNVAFGGGRISLNWLF